MTKKTIKTTENQIQRLKSSLIMFPKNHNNEIKTIIGQYDNGIYKSIIEIFSKNAYIFNAYCEPKKFESKEEMFKYMNSKATEISSSKEFNDDSSIYDSEKTFLFSIYKNLTTETVLIPSVPINLLLENSDGLLTIFADADIKIKKGRVCYVDITNDPTPVRAGGVISLGYYNWRIEIKNPKVISTNPITIQFKEKDLLLQMNRMCRRVM